MQMVQMFSGRSPMTAEILKDAARRPAAITFDRTYALDLGGVRVRFLVVGPTHTRGDTAFFVEGDNVLFAGDVVMNNSFLAATAVSSMKAWLAAFDTLEALKPQTIVPAHGEVGPGTIIATNRGIMQGVQARARALKAEGRSADEVGEHGAGGAAGAAPRLAARERPRRGGAESGRTPKLAMTRPAAHLRPPLAGRRALGHLRDLVPLRHRDDVLDLSRGRRARPAAARAARSIPPASHSRLSRRLRRWRVSRIRDTVRLGSFDGRPAYRFSGGAAAAVRDGTASGDRLRGRWHGAARGRRRDHGSRGRRMGRQAAERCHQAARSKTSTSGRSARCATCGRSSSTRGPTASRSTSTATPARWCSTRRPHRAFWAYLGAIPHWLYFTPLRKHQPQWFSFVVWSSLIGTIAALMGLVIIVWMYSPRKRYRYAGAPTSIPYRGWKRWHAIAGLFFGVVDDDVGVQRPAVDGAVSDHEPADRPDGAGGGTDGGRGRGGGPNVANALRGAARCRCRRTPAGRRARRLPRCRVRGRRSSSGRRSRASRSTSPPTDAARRG